MANSLITNERQRRFCQLYAAGPDEIRDNGPASYRAAGYTAANDRVASAGASRLLARVNIQREIARLHREADAEVINRLRDWKVLATEAQEKIVAILQGYFVDATNSNVKVPIRNRDTAMSAEQVRRAAELILERAYPSKVYAEMALRDPAKLLAEVLGVSPEQLPTPSQVEAHVNGSPGTAA